MRTLLGNTTRGLTTIESVGKQEVPTTKLITHFLQSMNMVKQYGAHTVSVHGLYRYGQEPITRVMSSWYGRIWEMTSVNWNGCADVD